jgi:hypothetical protein
MISAPVQIEKAVMTPSSQRLSTPVLFLIFNRPDMTQRVFAAIRKARPDKLFISADGARHDKPEELGLCNQVRRIVLDGIDWPCEVKTLFRDKNLGCKVAVSSAITWFFEQVEDGIILEDDCLPDHSFFCFCEELLERYREDPRIMMISGDNFQPVMRGRNSYLFSRYLHIWGWATWRRAWQKYDLAMRGWPELRDNGQLAAEFPPLVYRKALRLFDCAFAGKTSTWDTQWLFACWANSGMSILPNINLVSNIDSGGTHMKVYDPYINRPSGLMSFPLQHPGLIAPDEDADRYTQRYIYFRDWRRAFELMCKYLWRNFWQTPRHFPGAVKSLWLDCVAEIQERRALR